MKFNKGASASVRRKRKNWRLAGGAPWRKLQCAKMRRLLAKSEGHCCRPIPVKCEICWRAMALNDPERIPLACRTALAFIHVRDMKGVMPGNLVEPPKKTTQGSMKAAARNYHGAYGKNIGDVLDDWDNYGQVLTSEEIAALLKNA
ncbi:MAG: hypothetical protein OEY01_03240 [Desulfobulbaceae bacterium]|nr:hypothetical protein [Desulfobulbaceae bacterium]HIJ78306.1 hypothetical protein [Deltaproteobacteria bacterium]